MLAICVWDGEHVCVEVCVCECVCTDVSMRVYDCFALRVSSGSLLIARGDGSVYEWMGVTG
eukprot:m.12336 g.12336  ORF g.12336 m.12336 type:complete len:61 (-) comp5994_c0_seq1:186-368(-)